MFSIVSTLFPYTTLFRSKLKALLAEGQLDEREIEIEVTQQSPMMFDMMVPQGAPEGIDNLSEMLQDMLPKRKKKRSVKEIGRATSELQSPMYLVCRLLLE